MADLLFHPWMVDDQASVAEFAAICDQIMEGTRQQNEQNQLDIDFQVSPSRHQGKTRGTDIFTENFATNHVFKQYEENTNKQKTEIKIGGANPLEIFSYFYFLVEA